MSTSPLVLPAHLQQKIEIARVNAKNISDREAARLTMNCMDLTSVVGNETQDDIRALCDKAALYGLASVCILPQHVKQAAEHLKGTGVNVATVINFPSGEKRTGTEEPATVNTVVRDIARALMDGAAQVDIVYPYQKDEDYAREILHTAHMACPENVTLKTILETAAFSDAEALSRAAAIALDYGVDCLKTSTSRHPNGGATIEAVAVMLDAIERSGFDAGIKVTGGVRTVDDCRNYIALKRLYAGEDSISPENFRIGASALLDKLTDVFSGATSKSGNAPAASPATSAQPAY
ncbi:MAG: deoxyribose-phosphate aldolase [Pseudobdellovibrionaceae bacterium]